MEKAAAIKNIREHLAKGDIEAALQLLIETLEPERKQMRDLTNRAIQTKAQLEKNQRDELQGVISFENSKLHYNQITQQVIALVDEWENPAEFIPPQKRKFTPQMILVTAVLLVFAGLATFKIIKGNNNVGAADACPKFEQKSMFNIMVLPFDPVNSPGLESPHKVIVERLDLMQKKFAQTIKTSIKGKNDPTPQTDDEAIESGQNCQAKLVIWGKAERLSPPHPGTIVITKYKYLAPEETFAFTKLGLDDNSTIESKNELSNISTQGFFVDTILNFSSIFIDGKLTKGLENQFRLLFGVAVMQSGDAKGAIKILENTEAPDSSSSLLKDMALAESHMQTGDKKAAEKDLDRVLDQHPNYWFAINNRALLHYQAGEYVEALETVEKKLQEEPNNVPALTLRGAVRIQTKELKEAKEDLDAAERLNKDPEKLPYIRKKLELLENEKKREEQRKTQSTNIVANDRTNIAALTELAEANRNLGNYKVATEWADKVLNLDKTNASALAVKIESTLKLDKTGNALRIVKNNVQKLDAKTQNAVLLERPVLRTILKTKDQ